MTRHGWASNLGVERPHHGGPGRDLGRFLQCLSICAIGVETAFVLMLRRRARPAIGVAVLAGLQALALRFGYGGAALACGALTTALGLPSIVVTIGTMSLFRGVAQVVLGDQARQRCGLGQSA